MRPSSAFNQIVFKSFLLLSAACLLQSCNNNIADYSKYLNHNKLKEQRFEINPDRDTSVVAENGTVLKIKKGSISSDEAGKVTLLVREALTIEDMVLGGLQTKSNEGPLSSGGMISINGLPGAGFKINQPFDALLPTETYNPDMQVYEGVEEDGVVTWVNPVPMPTSGLDSLILEGRALYEPNCGNCHKIAEDFTGPALYGITDRRSRQWLHDFTRNPAAMIANDYYSMCIFDQWKPTVMTPFPQLTDLDLDAIYAYIKSESDKLNVSGLPIPKTCCDSCETLVAKDIREIDGSNATRLSNPKPGIMFQNDSSVNNEQEVNGNPEEENLLLNDTSEILPESKTYYALQVRTAGWYNIDILLKNLEVLSGATLTVEIPAEMQENIKVFFIIPSLKIFIEGFETEKDNIYDFGTDRLPIGAECYVIAFKESGEDIFYGKQKFTAQANNHIKLSGAKISEEAFFSDLGKIGVTERIPKQFDNTVDSPEQSDSADLRDQEPQLNQRESADSIMRFVDSSPCNCDTSLRYY